MTSSSQKVVVIVDNSNIFIEGQKYSAFEKGAPKNGYNATQDPSWRINFADLLAKIADGRMVEHAVLVGSRPPTSDKVWQMAENSGFTVTVHDRSAQGGEKAVDTELVAQGTEIICTARERMDLAILSGDRDFIPLVKMGQKHGWKVEMWAFKNSFNPAGEMASTVDFIKPLDEIFHEIGAYALVWP